MISEITSAVAEKAWELAGSLSGLIVHHLGPTGVLAACVVAAALAIVLVIKLIDVAVAATKYLVFPSVVLALVGSILFRIPFLDLLPVTTMLCSVVLVAKA